MASEVGCFPRNEKRSFLGISLRTADRAPVSLPGVSVKGFRVCGNLTLSSGHLSDHRHLFELHTIVLTEKAREGSTVRYAATVIVKSSFTAEINFAKFDASIPIRFHRDSLGNIDSDCVQFDRIAVCHQHKLELAVSPDSRTIQTVF